MNEDYENAFKDGVASAKRKIIKMIEEKQDQCGWQDDHLLQCVVEEIEELFKCIE